MIMAKEHASSSSSSPIRTAALSIRLSEFEIPPMQDLLLVGKRAPIGPEAVRRMVDALSPDQYDVVSVKHEIFEAIVVRRSLVKLLPLERLLTIILEEGERISTEDMVMKAQISISINVSREVDLK